MLRIAYENRSTRAATGIGRAAFDVSILVHLTRGAPQAFAELINYTDPAR